MIAPRAGLSVSRQCELLGIARSSFYYRPRPEAAEELDLRRLRFSGQVDKLRLAGLNWSWLWA